MIEKIYGYGLKQNTGYLFSTAILGVVQGLYTWQERTLDISVSLVGL